MDKSIPKAPQKDLTQFHQSTFTMTFAIEIIGMDVWHDCNEGWLDLGPCSQGMKIQYQLYPGQIYDVDILIWPHVVKVKRVFMLADGLIWCGANSGWVRTWQFLDRRWLTFDITHLFPVRVVDLRTFVATVTPTPGLSSLSSNAKNDKISEVYLPPLAFGERRYFGPVQDSDVALGKYMYDVIWDLVESFIPASYLDGVFDVPHPVTDVRHQDAVLYHVKECILSHMMPEESADTLQDLDEKDNVKDRRGSKISKDLKKKVEVPKLKFEIKLSGDTILAGTGRLVPFESVGDRPPELGEFIVLISSNALPAPDDLPIVFVNIDSIFDVPIDTFTKLKITHLYTKWYMGDEEHCSQPQLIKNKKALKFNDHHAVPMPRDLAFEWISAHVETFFRIQLRGIRQRPKADYDPKFFGYDKEDRSFATMAPPKPPNEDADFIIATTKIDVRSLAKGFNVMIRGEYDLYPPSTSVQSLEREAICSNDINGIRAPVYPTLVVQPYIVLAAQMTLEVCMGYVGCRPQRSQRKYSRMFCLVSDTNAIMTLLQHIAELNEELTGDMKKEECLTGFAIDVGDTVIFYAEGVKDGAILKVWEKTEDFYPQVKPMFSTSSKYYSRIYPSLLNTAVPFMVLKMCVPLSALLACPPVYARPAMPVLTRNAALKFGRLVAGNLKDLPPRCDMPTPEELTSFRLELCVPPRPSVLQSDNPPLINMPAEPVRPVVKQCHSSGKINFT